MKNTNEEYTQKEYNLMEIALQNILKRTEKGLQYGWDMRSSKHSCIEDIQMIATGLNDILAGNVETIKLKGKGE